MENLKEIWWKQRFENFDKSYKLLKKYSDGPIVTELEKAGIIQFFEIIKLYLPELEKMHEKLLMEL